MALPQPPSDQQKYMYLKQKKGIFYCYALASSILLFSGMYLFSWVNPALFFYSIFVTFLLLYIAVSYAVGVKGKPFDFLLHQKTVSENAAKDVSIDIYLPICGEPFEIVANTWRYVKLLDWPAHLLKVWVLDDGYSDDAQKLAKEMGFEYVRRDNRPTLKKAGNIRNAFKISDGQFIVILDADFCPRHDFLHETIPYLISDPKIAIVQTPQFFEIKSTQTWVEQAASSVQELFYRLIQVSRNTWGASICVGSCGIYRRSALEPMGGTYPIEHSEDLHTGFSMLMAGFKVYYIPINLAMGVCPDTHPGFFIQQYRWCTGSTSLLTNPMFWKHKLPLMARLSFLSGMGYYLATASALWLAVLPSMVMVWVMPEKLMWFTMIFYTPSFLFGVFFMRWWTFAPYSLDVLKVRQLSYWAHFFALRDKFFKSTVPWIPTGAAKNNIQRFKTFRDYIFWWTSISTAVVLTGAFYNMLHYFDYNFYPTIFFACFNYWLNMSILKEQEL